MYPPEINHELSQCSEALRLYVAALCTENERLSQENINLHARLNLNSNNSSKPPSTDAFKKTIKNSRKKSGRLSGGQLGHKGRTLEKVLNPDEVIEFKIPEICNCGFNMTDVPTTTNTRQVFEMIKPKIQTTEYVTYETVCPKCGKVHATHFPPQVTQPTQYGENMQALMNYFTHYQLLPLNRTAEAIKHITGQSVSEGTIVNAAKRLYQKLEEPVNEIKKQITGSPVVHFDETGMRSESKTRWLHVAATENCTYYEVNNKRGEEAAKDIGILPNFNGAAVHDHWMSYYKFSDCTHAECNAHHIRYLKDIHDNYKQSWAEEMLSMLIKLHRRVEELKAQQINNMLSKEIDEWYNFYHSIIDKGIIEDSQKSPVILNKKGKPKKSKSLQLLLKLQQYDIETLAFMYDFAIPFDNNMAERDLRMQKLRQKISGCFRGKDGANVFCRIRSYISTAKKNKINVMDAITKAIIDKPYIPES